MFSQSINFEKKTGVIVENKMKDRVNRFKPIGTFDGTLNYYLMPYENDILLSNLYRVEKYDFNMNLITHVRLNMTVEGKKKKKLNEIIYFQNKLYLFTSFRNEAQKKIYLFVQTMDKKTFAINDDIRKFAEIGYNKKKRNAQIKTDYTVSEDGSKLLIYAHSDNVKYITIQRNITGKETKQIKQILYVFDKDVNLLYEQNIGTAISSGVLVMNEYHIDNNANVYITGRNYKDYENSIGIYLYKKNKKHRLISSDKYYTYIQPSNYQTSILYYGNKGSVTKQFNLNLGQKFIKNATIKPNGNSVFCAGIYSLQGTVSAKGAFSCQLNLNTGKTEKIYTTEFNKKDTENNLDSLDLILFKKTVGANETDPYSYGLSKIEKTATGDYIFIAEKQLVGKLESRSGNQTSVYSTFDYNDLFVVRLKSTGLINRIDMIEKTQFALALKVNSYIHMIKNNNIYFIYTDIVPNPKLISVSKFKNTYLVELMKTGEQRKEIITKFEETNKSTIFMNPGAEIVIPNKGIFIYPIKSSMNKYRAFEKITIK